MSRFFIIPQGYAFPEGKFPSETTEKQEIPLKELSNHKLVLTKIVAKEICNQADIFLDCRANWSLHCPLNRQS